MLLFYINNTNIQISHMYYLMNMSGCESATGRMYGYVSGCPNSIIRAYQRGPH